MLGLVLEGGGAKGAYHVGVYGALLKKNIVIHGVTGTSIGSINGAMIAQGDYSLLRELWEHLDSEEVFGVDLSLLVPNDTLSIEHFVQATAHVRDMITSGGIDIEPIHRYLSRYINEDKVRASFIDFGLVTTNLTTRRAEKLFLEDIPRGELVDYLIASSYLPVFKSEKIHGFRYLDGGFSDNLPFGMLLDRGFDELILVKNQGFGFNQKIPQHIKVTLIEPNKDLGSIYDFTAENSRRLIQMGTLDTLKIFGDLYGDQYYFSGDPTTFSERLFQLDPESIKKVATVLEMEQATGEAGFRMYLLPRMAQLLGLKDCPSPEKIALAFLEHAFKHYDMNPSVVYDLNTVGVLLHQRSPKKIKAPVSSIEHWIRSFQSEEKLISLYPLFF